MRQQAPPRLSNCYIPQPKRSITPTNYNNRTDNDDDNNNINSNSIVEWMNINLSERILPLMNQNTNTDKGNVEEMPPPNSSTCSSRIQQRTTNELRRLRIESDILVQQQQQQQRSSSAIVVGSNNNIQLPISGSSLVELGRTKVICTVSGPIPSTTNISTTSTSSSTSQNDGGGGGTVQVQVSYLPQSSYPVCHIPLASNTPTTQDSTNQQSQSVTTIQQQQQSSSSVTKAILLPKQRNMFIQQLESKLSKQLMNAIIPAIPLHIYNNNNNQIYIHCMVLYDDGSIIPTCITAINIALCNAQIDLYDTITSCTVAMIYIAKSTTSTSLSTTTNNDNNNNDSFILLADPTLDEISVADSIITIVLLPNCNEITLWDQQRLYHHHHHQYDHSQKTFLQQQQQHLQDAIALCYDGCNTMHQFIRQHLLLRKNIE